MLLCREATAEREKRCGKSHILDPDPSFGVRRSVIYIFNAAEVEDQLDPRQYEYYVRKLQNLCKCTSLSLKM